MASKVNVPALPGQAAAKAKRGKALSTMRELEALYATDARAAAAAAPAPEGPPRISAKDQVFWVNEQTLPDPLEVIVLAEAHLNVYYETDYDPENPSPPSCFAVGPVLQRDADGNAVPGTGEAALGAHPSSPDAQGGPAANGIEHPCATCEMNQFGSARVGRGKACSNTRQLAVVMADDPALADPSKGEPRIAILGLSATALSPWGKYVNGLARIEGRPPHGVVTRFSFNKTDADERKRKAVVPIGYRLIEDGAVAVRAIELRREALESGVLVRPMPVEVRKPAAARAAKGGSRANGARGAARKPARF